MRCAILTHGPDDNRPDQPTIEQIRAMLAQLPADERKAFIAAQAADLLTPAELATLKSRGHYRSNVRLMRNLSRGETANPQAAYHDRSLARAPEQKRDTVNLGELPTAPQPQPASRVAARPALADPNPPKPARTLRPATMTSPWVDRSLLLVEWACAMVIIFILGQWVVAQWSSDSDTSNGSAVAQTAEPTAAAPAITLKPTAIPTLAPTATRAAYSPAQVTPVAPPTVTDPTPTATATLPPPTSTPLPATTITDSLPVRIVIPSIKVDSVVKEVQLHMDTWQVADYAVGHHESSALPGQQGNVVLAGHRDIRGSVFRRLNELKAKDEVLVYTKGKVFRYVVTDSKVIKPTQVSVMAQTDDYRLTLITCTPIGIASNRIIVTAQLVREEVPVIGGDQ